MHSLEVQLVQATEGVGRREVLGAAYVAESAPGMVSLAGGAAAGREQQVVQNVGET